MNSRTTDQAGCGECTGYATSRRAFLGLGAAAGLAGVSTTMLGDVMTSAVFGAQPGERILVVLSQRGGADGLSIVVPHAEKAYYDARPSIAVEAGSLLVPDARFGLHPALKPLLPMWSKGRMAAIQAVGMPQWSDADKAFAARVQKANGFKPTPLCLPPLSAFFIHSVLLLGSDKYVFLAYRPQQIMQFALRVFHLAYHLSFDLTSAFPTHMKCVPNLF